MSGLILLYVALIAVVVIGIIAATMLYRSRRRGSEPAGQPHVAPPMSEHAPPQGREQDSMS